jgi:simple sugar transport system substrate-binding protein
LTKRKLALAAATLVIAAAAAVLALGTSPGSAKTTAAYKVAWIYVGPHNDGGWSQAHDVGRLAVQKALGSKVQTTYKENIAPGRSSTRPCRACTPRATR